MLAYSPQRTASQGKVQSLYRASECSGSAYPSSASLTFPSLPSPLLWPLKHLQLPKHTRLCLASVLWTCCTLHLSPPFLLVVWQTSVHHWWLHPARSSFFFGYFSKMDLSYHCTPRDTDITLLHFVLPSFLPRRQGQSSLVQHLTPRRRPVNVCWLNEFHGGGQEVERLSPAGRNGWLVAAFEDKVGVDFWAGCWGQHGALGKMVSWKQIQGSTWELMICQGEMSVEGEGQFIY